jgi:general secretion pathway protein I
LSQSRQPENPSAGFTLIECLVAISIVAIGLSSIGALVASTVRTTRAIEGKLQRLAAARSVLGALPDRDHLVVGTQSGDVPGHQWRLNVSALTSADTASQQPGSWVPQLVVVNLNSATAGTMQISTVRLRRKEAR